MTGQWLPANEAENFHPDRYDFEWNEDHSRFRAHKLRWHDESSYAHYQSDSASTMEDREVEDREEFSDSYAGRKALDRWAARAYDGEGRYET